ncbi:hypothetical protein FNJ88_09785 [Chryseobacterium sp. SNU WT5]|uniref:hypothetical protein n=1 Tax=Chryseobacterium sp. SNU WT5 TaxID=2594269 RepID=UPI0011812721|nr:hypothetical protein [Chryseobacterium sp. SNU WT5]QDP85818.1 hypothetical protein FNJ88_09785 [Chryseobacterium sp. SNU WT5]
MRFDQGKVYIDPSSNIIYSSYYIKGLYEVFGKKNVSFSTCYFESLNKRKDDYSYDAYMALVIVSKGKKNKVIIDFGDDYPIRENAYEWCDVYAKINYDPKRTRPYFKEKIHSIPPSFGIKIWNVSKAIYYCVSNLIKLKFNPQISLKNYFRSYLSQIKQLRLESFLPNHKEKSVQEKSVFFIASLWPHANCLTGTNRYRKMYIDSCLKNGVHFEGGFWVTDTGHPQFKEFKQLTFTRRYPLREFIEKTKKSLFVFNTPAVHHCHGWKLGQFLAMNKAIISTPFQNVLPVDLEHGKNIHFVKNEHDIAAAIEKLVHDEEYRTKLEEGAQKYYLKYAEPAAVISHINQKLKLNSAHE